MGEIMRPTIFIAALALCVSASSGAQELQPQPATGITWHWVELTKYHPGKIDRAGELTRQYFDPVDKEIGTEVISIHLNTGEWDRIEAIKMPGGAADLGWRVSPNEAQFMNALARRAGGMTAAQKIMDEYNSLIARKETHVAHMHP